MKGPLPKNLTHLPCVDRSREVHVANRLEWPEPRDEEMAVLEVGPEVKESLVGGGKRISKFRLRKC